MENKKLGFLILGFSVITAIIMFGYMTQLNKQTRELNCYPNQECERVNSLLGLSHISIGLISFIFALGFYLLFFNKGEEAILKRLEEEKNMKINEDKFDIILMPLDENEKKILKAIREQAGITQTTLRLRTDVSKSKISQILTDFERKNLIRRVTKGKTYSVYLTENL